MKTELYERLIEAAGNVVAERDCECYLDHTCSICELDQVLREVGDEE